MIRTYTRTTMKDNAKLRNATIRIECFKRLKYVETKPSFVMQYSGLTSWDVVDGDEAKELEAHTDGSCVDENHEYLVLHFEDGSDATFRNSHTDMFIL